jgi:hypothetical protein
MEKTIYIFRVMALFQLVPIFQGAHGPLLSEVCILMMNYYHRTAHVNGDLIECALLQFSGNVRLMIS